MTVDEATGTRMRGLAEQMARLDTLEVVTELGRMNRTDRAVAFRLLAKDRALAVFEDLDPALQAEVLTGLRSESAAEIVSDLDPEDRAGLLDELPASVTSALLHGLTPAERDMTNLLLGYPEHAVGRRMSPEVASVSARSTVREAIARTIEMADRVATIYAIAVVGEGREVVGVVSLRRLLVHDGDMTVDQVMSPPRMAHARDDQEKAARLVASSGHVAIPVVDDERRLVGVLTVDDAMRILDEEEAEDDARIGGSTALTKPYLAVPVLGVVRNRIVWLLILIVAASLTVGVQSLFEDTLAQVVALALFIPLLVGTGGNAGAQAGTTIVRALAVGDVRTSDLLRVMRRELLTGFLLGIMLGTVGFFPASWVAGPGIALVMSLTIVAICSLATTVGSAVPVIAKRVGIDPALVCSPFITTIVDTSGLIIYFLIAKAVLGL